jgi:NitT/TauT family transport system ATP-binding protein
MFISIRGISKVFEAREGELEALREVNFEIEKGEFVALVGISGCGKSTMLFIVAGLIPPTSGEVRVANETVQGPSADRAVVFQGDAVFPWMTVEENIAYGLRFKKTNQDERKETVNRLVRLVGLEGFERSYPKELSGGMKKRVDLARAYAVDPSVLLMDEPFGALDAITKEKMQVDLARLSKAIGQQKTVLFVTHDLEEAIFLADRILVMGPRPGTIREAVKVELPGSRTAEMRTYPEFQALRKRLSDILASYEAQ